jgi:hypothetical protein
MTHFWNKLNQCKVKRLESQIIIKSWGARKLMGPTAKIRGRGSLVLQMVQQLKSEGEDP